MKQVCTLNCHGGFGQTQKTMSSTCFGFLCCRACAYRVCGGGGQPIISFDAWRANKQPWPSWIVSPLLRQRLGEL